jgi:hypothetical protein
MNPASGRFFEKNSAKNLFSSEAGRLEPPKAQKIKVFLLLFVHKKQRFLSMLNRP